MTKYYPKGNPEAQRRRQRLAAEKRKPPPKPTPRETPAYSWNDVEAYRKVDRDAAVREAADLFVTELEPDALRRGAARFYQDIGERSPDVQKLVRKLFSDPE